MLAWSLCCALACLTLLEHVRAGRRLELVARASHELRGPLTAARLALQSARRDPRHVEAVELELRRAALALTDLEAARAGRGGGIRRELVDVGLVCRTQVRAWAPVAKAAGVRLTCTQSGDVHVLGDRDRLAQATGNLLANALEHGRGDVELRVCVRHGRARVEVSDHGLGLGGPLPARPPRRGRGKRGRGLTITAGIAAGHGGRLSAAPTASGTTMALEFPLAA